MAIECYHAVCPFHSCNRGENEGPFCYESECQFVGIFRSFDWRRIELFRGYELTRLGMQIPSVDCVVEYKIDDCEQPILCADVLLASAHDAGEEVYICSINYNPGNKLLCIDQNPDYWVDFSASYGGITVPDCSAFLVAKKDFDLRRYTGNVCMTLGLKIVAENNGYEF